MLWLAFAFSGPILWAISTHLDKYLVEKYFKDADVAVLLVFTAFAGLLLLPFIWIFQPGVADLDLRSMALMAFAGLLYMVAMVFYLRALQAEDAAVVAPFFQASPLFGYVLAYLILGETLSPVQLAGCALIVGGTLLVSWREGPRGRRINIRLAALMLVCAFALALSALIFKAFALRDEFWTTTFWMYVGEALFGAGLLAYPPYRRQLAAMLRINSGAVMGINAANELINLAGGLGMRYALLLAPLSLVQAVGSTTTLFVFAIALILAWRPGQHAEAPTRKELWRKGAAAVLVTLGVALVSR
jgi:uncharacterized membrane protein